MRYFFHFRSADGVEVTDDDGDELSDASAAEDHAVAAVKEMVRGSSLDWRKASFEVYDEANRHVVTVWFNEAAVRPRRTDHRSPPEYQHI